MAIWYNKERDYERVVDEILSSIISNYELDKTIHFTNEMKILYELHMHDRSLRIFKEDFHDCATAAVLRWGEIKNEFKYRENGNNSTGD